jgi:hypothetical protein
MNKLLFLTITIMFSLYGCSYKYTNKVVTISDYIVGSPYKIIAVDGKRPKRSEHGFIVTVAPLVLVNEGKHILTVRQTNMEVNRDEIGSAIDIEVELTVGNSYRIINSNGKPVLIIDDRK